MNAVDPVFNEGIFDAAFEAGKNYMDMAMNLSTPHPARPHEKTGVKLGDYQFAREKEWENKRILALLGMGVEVAPRDVIAACLPNPAALGDRMSGKTCAGTWVTGTKNGKRREVYLYQVADNKTCMRRTGSQAVVAQTPFTPVITMERLATGAWRATGVQGPEAFDPRPFVQRMRAYGFPYKIQER